MVDAYVRNQSSSVTIEYFDENLDVDCGEEITDFEMDNEDGYVYDGDFVVGRHEGATGFKNGKPAEHTGPLSSLASMKWSPSDNTCEFNSRTCAID